MTQAAAGTLPEDPRTLKAMLTAERPRSYRMITKECSAIDTAAAPRACRKTRRCSRSDVEPCEPKTAAEAEANFR